MTISNLLSISRIIVGPVIVLLTMGSYHLSAFVLFLLASTTDYLDGHFARRYKTISKVGAFIDPFADKILIFCAFFAFYLLKHVALWMVLVIVLRDILVTSLRIIMIHNGSQLVTSQSAKLKTAAQFTAVFILFISLLTQNNFLQTITPSMMYLVVVITCWTGVTYFL